MAYLYDLTKELAALHDELEENGGELTPIIEEKLSTINMNIEQKADSYGRWIVNLQSDEEALEREIERLTLRKQRREKVRERLKAEIKTCMELAGIKKINTPLFPIRIQKNGGKASVFITDEKKVPARFHDIIPQHTEINNDRIREAAEAGEDVSEFAKVERGTHLRIG